MPALLDFSSPLGGYLMFGQEAGCDLWLLDGSLPVCACGICAAVRIPVSSGWAGREEKGGTSPARTPPGDRDWEMFKNKQQQVHIQTFRRQKRTPLSARDPGANVGRFSVLKRSRELFWMESKDNPLCKSTKGGRSVLSCRSCVKYKCSRVSSQKALVLKVKICTYFLLKRY